MTPSSAQRWTADRFDVHDASPAVRDTHPQPFRRALQSGLGIVVVLALVACGGGEESGGDGSGGSGNGDSASTPSDGSGGGGDSADTGAGQAATLTGRVRFEGDAPAPKKIDVSGTPQCVELHPDPIFYDELVVGADGGVANCIVYLNVEIDPDNNPYPVPEEPAVLDQVNCVYIPHVQAIRCDQPVKIVNSDPLSHNVNYTPRNNEGDNIGMPRPSERTREFPEPDFHPPIKFVCNMHKWMSAYIAVFPHPFFAVTGEDGTFTIDGVPPGTYTLKIWHESQGAFAESELELSAGESEEVPEFTLPQ